MGARAEGHRRGSSAQRAAAAADAQAEQGKKTLSWMNECVGWCVICVRVVGFAKARSAASKLQSKPQAGLARRSKPAALTGSLDTYHSSLSPLAYSVCPNPNAPNHNAAMVVHRLTVATGLSWALLLVLCAASAGRLQAQAPAWSPDPARTIAKATQAMRCNTPRREMCDSPRPSWVFTTHMHPTQHTHARTHAPAARPLAVCPQICLVVSVPLLPR